MIYPSDARKKHVLKSENRTAEETERKTETAYFAKTVPDTFYSGGAQGGTAADVAGAFDENGLGALINSSRAIIFAYEREPYVGASSWQAAVEQTTLETKQRIAADTSAGRL